MKLLGLVRWRGKATLPAQYNSNCGVIGHDRPAVLAPHDQDHALATDAAVQIPEIVVKQTKKQRPHFHFTDCALARTMILKLVTATTLLLSSLLTYLTINIQSREYNKTLYIIILLMFIFILTFILPMIFFFLYYVSVFTSFKS